MVYRGPVSLRSSARWSRVLLAAGALTLWALGGVHPLTRPHFAVAALLSAGGSTTPAHQPAPEGLRTVQLLSPLPLP